MSFFYWAFQWTTVIKADSHQACKDRRTNSPPTWPVSVDTVPQLPVDRQEWERDVFGSHGELEPNPGSAAGTEAPSPWSEPRSHSSASSDGKCEQGPRRGPGAESAELCTQSVPGCQGGHSQHWDALTVAPFPRFHRFLWAGEETLPLTSAPLPRCPSFGDATMWCSSSLAKCWCQVSSWAISMFSLSVPA